MEGEGYGVGYRIRVKGQRGMNDGYVEGCTTNSIGIVLLLLKFSLTRIVV